MDRSQPRAQEPDQLGCSTRRQRGVDMLRASACALGRLDFRAPARRSPSGLRRLPTRSRAGRLSHFSGVAAMAHFHSSPHAYPRRWITSVTRINKGHRSPIKTTFKSHPWACYPAVRRRPNATDHHEMPGQRVFTQKVAEHYSLATRPLTAVLTTLRSDATTARCPTLT